MKHLVENFIKQFDIGNPRKIMTKETYRYISSLHRRYIFSDGKYGVYSNFIYSLPYIYSKYENIINNKRKRNLDYIIRAIN